MLTSWRIASRRHDPMSGLGAAEYGGRWNSPGRGVIYAGESFAIALLERLVYLPTGRIPADQVYVRISIPDNVSVEEPALGEITGWDMEDHVASRAYGDAWYDSARTAVLLVPSVVTRLDRNLVFNSSHPDFRHVQVSAAEPVRWDARLFRRQSSSSPPSSS